MRFSLRFVEDIVEVLGGRLSPGDTVAIVCDQLFVLYTELLSKCTNVSHATLYCYLIELIVLCRLTPGGKLAIAVG
jgi:hypothetical protein